MHAKTYLERQTEAGAEIDWLMIHDMKVLLFGSKIAEPMPIDAASLQFQESQPGEESPGLQGFEGSESPKVKVKFFG